MKKNKLTLAAGILMVIVASFSIIAAVEYAVWFNECANIIYAMADSITMDNLNFVIEAIAILGLTFLSIIEGILYMIWGVKLIKKTNKFVPVEKMKKWLITILVFSYIFAFLHFSDFSTLLSETGLFLAIAILLTVAVSKSGNNTNAVSVEGKISQSTLDAKTIEKMTSIKKLRDENVISEEEYQKLRDKVLSDIINFEDDTQDNK